MSWKHSSGAEGMQNVILWDAVPGASANRLFKLNELRKNLCCLLQSGVLEGNAGDRAPIVFTHALSDGGHEPVVDKTRHRHRPADSSAAASTSRLSLNASGNLKPTGSNRLAAIMPP